MLRLAPTHIALGSRDIIWHKERQNARYDREDQHASGSVNSRVRDHQESAEQPNPILLHSFPHLLPATAPVMADDFESALISKDPVPRGSRIFWDQIMADAGVPTGIQVQNVEKRPRITEMPHDSQEMIRSSKGSIEEDLPSSSGNYHDSLGISHFQNPSNETETNLQFLSRFSSESESSFEKGDEKNEPLVGNNPPETLHQFDLPIRSSSMSSYSGKFRGPTSQEDCAINSHLPGDTKLDGCSDPIPAHQDHQRKRASTIGVEPEYNATRSIAQTPRIGAGLFFERTSPSGIPRSPQLPLPRSVDKFRHRSTSGLPRSPLYMSQAAVSSSPEKRPRPSENSSDDDSGGKTISEPSGLLPQPPRLRKKHRARTRNEGYIFDEAALESAQVYGMDLLSIDDPLQSSRTSSLSSRTGSVSDHQQVSPGPQNPLFSSPPASGHRNTSPYFLPSISTPTLPPHPFSATPRTVSSHLPLSPSSPSASNSTRPNFPPSPAHQRMAVYNDNLPASVQPQTPAHLPHNGLPAMSLRSPFVIGIGVAQTAPAGIGRHRRNSFRPTTPTRRGRTIEDQENLGVEMESRRRRIRESPSREWEWEWALEGDDEQDEESEAGEGGLV